MKSILTAGTFMVVCSLTSFAQTKATKATVVSQKKASEPKLIEVIEQPATADSVHVIHSMGREMKTEEIQVSPEPVNTKKEAQTSPMISTSKKPE